VRRSFWLLFFVLAATALGSRARGAELNPRSVSAAAEYARTQRGYSLLIVQNGRTLHEERTEQRFPIFSGTKAFWCFATLSAVQEGLLSLDEPVSDTITEWRADPRRRNIHLRQLLDFTSGLESASQLHRRTRANRDREALRVSLVAAPGSAFTYGPSHLQVLDELLRRKLHGGSTTDFLERRVLHPIGIHDAVDFKPDLAGNPLLASGFELSASEWSKVGRFILAHLHGGSRAVCSPEVLNECFHSNTVNPAFGLIFWLNREAKNPAARVVDVEAQLDLGWQRANWRHACLSHDAPADLVVSVGSYGQRLYVLPSLDLIVVRQGGGRSFRDAAFLHRLLAP